MLKRVFLFNAWQMVVITMLISSGKPLGYVKMLTFFKQYITSIPITAKGRTLLNLVIIWGIFLFPLKTKKGIALKRKVVIAIININSRV